MKQNRDFFQLVYEVVRKVPTGRVTSYGAIARYLGSPGADRMVGWAMNKSHTESHFVPAHRVVNRMGLLTGKHDPTKPPAEGTRFSNELKGKSYTKRYWSSENFKAVSRFQETMQKRGHSMAQFSIAWVLINTTITSVICGANSIKQLEENLGAIDITLTEEELQTCDEVWQELRPPRFWYGDQQLKR